MMFPRFMFMMKHTPVKYPSLLVIALVLPLTAVGCRTCDGFSKEKTRKNQESGRENTNDGRVDTSDSLTPTKTKNIDGAECASLWKKVRKIIVDGCTNKGDRDLALELGRSVHCACLKGEGHCCFYFAQAAAVARLSKKVEMTSAIRDELYKRYWKKGCELGCPSSCIAYRRTTWSISTKDIAKIWETEPDMVKEIKRLCKNGSYYACRHMLDIGSALHSTSKEKEKKETGLNLIHKYGKKFCSLHGREGCSYYANALTGNGMDKQAALKAYEIFRKQCEKLKDGDSCLSVLYLSLEIEEIELTVEEAFDLRWKTMIYAKNPIIDVDHWLPECLVKNVAERFEHKCNLWKERVKEYEKTKVIEKPRCNFSYKEFLCPKEMIEPKKKREVSPYFKLIKDHLEPPVSIQKLIEKSESRADQKPKGNPKPRERPESDGSAK